MPDLDRWEEYSREQRQAGGPYDPEPYEPHWAYVKPFTPAPVGRTVIHDVPVPLRPTDEIVKHWTWAPSWEDHSVPMVTFIRDGRTHEAPVAH